jgi:hypothetical protein
MQDAPLNAAWQEAYEERAAILEYDAGYPRKEAEAKARRMLPPQPPPEKNSPQYRAFQKFWHKKG